MIPGKRQMTSVSEKLEEAFCTLSGGEQAGSLRTENLMGRFREPSEDRLCSLVCHVSLDVTLCILMSPRLMQCVLLG